MAKKKKKTIRTAMRKNRGVRVREKDLTRRYTDKDHVEDSDLVSHEQVSGKGEITRKRTIENAEIVEDATGTVILPDIDREVCIQGRVLRVQGLVSLVLAEDGEQYRCATRRLLKTMSTSLRHVVAAGDNVWIRIAIGNEGIIERVEPRHGVLCRTSRGRQHVLVSNVDLIIIVATAAEPRIKPNLIDRFLVTAERVRIQPIICINKMDLIEPAEMMQLVGVYSQMGYEVIFTSAKTGQGVEQLRARLKMSASVVAGQSGVGKSTLLNLIEPELKQRVRAVSQESQKGRHTTTTSTMVALTDGGFVIDTPGIRSFELWDVIPEEVEGYFRDIRPFVSHCRFHNCTHTHENSCAVKGAVADGWIDYRRYESYVQIRSGEMA